MPWVNSISSNISSRVNTIWKKKRGCPGLIVVVIILVVGLTPSGRNKGDVLN